MNRRQFLQWIAGAVALGGWQTTAKFDTDARIAGVTGALQRRPQEGKTKVVVARHPRLYKLPDDKPPHTLGMRTLYETIFELLEAGMLELTNARSWADAWRKFVKPTDVVGIKVNCIAGASLSSNPMLVNAIVAGLRSAGVPYSRIIVWDRSTRELSRAGFKVRMRPPGVLCYGTDAVGYRKQLSSFGEVATRVSNIVAEQCTVLINVPVLKTHYLSGLTAALKNHYGSINNPNKFHLNGCNPFIADVNCLPEIRFIQRLVICDALRPLYHGGPDDNPRFRWNYGGIIVSADPVAVDACGAVILEDKRKATRLGALRPEPAYLDTAADFKHSLGTNDFSKMNAVEVELSS